MDNRIPLGQALNEIPNGINALRQAYGLQHRPWPMNIDINRNDANDINRRLQYADEIMRGSSIPPPSTRHDDAHDQIRRIYNLLFANHEQPHAFTEQQASRFLIDLMGGMLAGPFQPLLNEIRATIETAAEQERSMWDMAERINRALASNDLPFNEANLENLHSETGTSNRGELRDFINRKIVYDMADFHTLIQEVDASYDEMVLNAGGAGPITRPTSRLAENAGALLASMRSYAPLIGTGLALAAASFFVTNRQPRAIIMGLAGLSGLGGGPQIDVMDNFQHLPDDIQEFIGAVVREGAIRPDIVIQGADAIVGDRESMGTIGQAIMAAIGTAGAGASSTAGASGWDAIIRGLDDAIQTIFDQYQNGGGGSSGTTGGGSTTETFIHILNTAGQNHGNIRLIAEGAVAVARGLMGGIPPSSAVAMGATLVTIEMLWNALMSQQPPSQPASPIPDILLSPRDVRVRPGDTRAGGGSIWLQGRSGLPTLQHPQLGRPRRFRQRANPTPPQGETQGLTGGGSSGPPVTNPGVDPRERGQDPVPPQRPTTGVRSSTSTGPPVTNPGIDPRERGQDPPRTPETPTTPSRSSILASLFALVMNIPHTKSKTKRRRSNRTGCCTQIVTVTVEGQQI